MPSTSKAACGQTEPEKTKRKPSTKKKTSKKRVSTPPVLKKNSVQKVDTKEGVFEVGNEYQVLHYSSLRWETLLLKKIEEDAEGNLTFSFYSHPPGWMTVRQDRVRQLPTKGRGRKKNVEQD